MTSPTPGPYRPHPKPHLSRTAVILALLAAALVCTLRIAWAVGDGVTLPQDQITRPFGQLPTTGYDPGLYTPFTQAPEAPR